MAKPWAITHRKVIENHTGGTVTKTYSVEKVLTIGASVIYSGTRKVTGNWTRWACDGIGCVKTGQYGKAQSWTDAVDGGVRCDATVPKSNLAAAVKKKYF
ncbi:hypothetical protein OG194_06620 [Streptomyces sp. NBC_01288]|uniref:hypothetical protein n=1 Tax=Streptomyces sp. NBC_01288 TaxID=2903814 RepID=UPI002E162A2A|nr:hypothetical protein OG194_06620 [Streptomyces sp. NBC_01288]